MGNMGNGGWIMGEDITVYLYRCSCTYYELRFVKKNPVMSYPHSQYKDPPPLGLSKLEPSETAQLCR